MDHDHDRLLRDGCRTYLDPLVIDRSVIYECENDCGYKEDFLKSSAQKAECSVKEPAHGAGDRCNEACVKRLRKGQACFSAKTADKRCDTYSESTENDRCDQ